MYYHAVARIAVGRVLAIVVIAAVGFVAFLNWLLNRVFSGSWIRFMLYQRVVTRGDCRLGIGCQSSSQADRVELTRAGIRRPAGRDACAPTKLELLQQELKTGRLQ